jgi:hypothetical protein
MWLRLGLFIIGGFMVNNNTKMKAGYVKINCAAIGATVKGYA